MPAYKSDEKKDLNFLQVMLNEKIIKPQKAVTKQALLQHVN
ncbi:MAG: hypothetical protein AAGA18_09470 [Verrucomicrobiota bacterium]